MDLWEEHSYRRCFTYQGKPLAIQLRQQGKGRTPVLVGRILAGPDSPEAIEWLRNQLAWILGFDQDLRQFYQHALQDPVLGPVAIRYEGFRPPRFASLFEGLVNAIACQQVSLLVGITLLNRLCQLCDTKAPEGPLAFPSPQQILLQEPAALRTLGFSRQKIRAIYQVAERAAAGELVEREWRGLPLENIRERLLNIPGIGRWSAEYAMLRALGRLEIFPADDVGARKGLLAWLGEDNAQAGYAEILQRVRRWHPYEGLLYLLMLLRRLDREGHFANDSSSR
ncbi:DNA-3-methyladenine glycosylase 2 [Acidithiobacillus sp. AC3]